MERRLADVDADIAALEARLAEASGSNPDLARAVALMEAVRSPLQATHALPASFTPGQAVDLAVESPNGPATAYLWYRHVNAAERWVRAEMTASGARWGATIPAAYTDTAYPLQYYFEFRSAPDKAWLVPGLDEKLLNQPYYVLRRE